MRSRRCSDAAERCWSTGRKESAELVASGCTPVVGVTCRVAVLTVGFDGATPLTSAASGAASSSASVLTSALAASDSAAMFGGSMIAHEPDIAAAAAELARFGIFGLFVAIAALGCVRAPTRPVATRGRVAAADLVTVPAIAASGRAGVDRTLDLDASIVGRSGVARRRSSSALKIVNASRRRSDSREDAGVTRRRPQPGRRGGRLADRGGGGGAGGGRLGARRPVLDGDIAQALQRSCPSSLAAGCMLRVRTKRR